MSSDSNVNRAPVQDRMENGKSCCCVSKMLAKIQAVLRQIVKHELVIKIVVVCYMILLTATAGLGLMNLWTSCEAVRRISVFLVVKGATAGLFWIVLIILLCKVSLSKALENTFYMWYLILDSIFGIIWMILGTVWTFTGSIEHLSNCGTGIWHPGVYIAVYIVIFLNWGFAAAFGFFYGYTACAERKEKYAKEAENDSSQDGQEHA